MRNYQYLYGPVPSRRLGRSLGVDLTPYKTCSQDCVFCQLGRTAEKTITRQEYARTDAELAELQDWLKTDGVADHITLSGTGEPTLHSGFGEVLKFIRAKSEIPAVLLTNGTMLHLPEVRTAACHANIVQDRVGAGEPITREISFKKPVHYRSVPWGKFIIPGSESCDVKDVMR